MVRSFFFYNKLSFQQEKEEFFARSYIYKKYISICNFWQLSYLSWPEIPAIFFTITLKIPIIVKFSQAIILFFL